MGDESRERHDFNHKNEEKVKPVLGNAFKEGVNIRTLAPKRVNIGVIKTFNKLKIVA